MWYQFSVTSWWIFRDGEVVDRVVESWVEIIDVQDIDVDRSIGRQAHGIGHDDFKLVEIFSLSIQRAQ